MNSTPKIAFVGAGSVDFTRILLGDILAFRSWARARSRCTTSTPSGSRPPRASRADRRARRGATPTIAPTLDRRAALDGADYVINMIQVGGHAATVIDHEIPARHGLRQTIGDTLGIGGIFRTLRTIPVMLGIGDDMAEVCPDAWLLNYTNPMAMLCQATYSGSPQQNGRRALPLGPGHDPRSWRSSSACHSRRSRSSAPGVNHQAFILRFEHDGESLYPRLDEAIERDPELLRRVRVEIYRRLGYFPTESSEHSAEYLPWYMRHDSEIERLRIPVATYVARSEENLEEYELDRERLAAGAAPRSSAASSTRRRSSTRWRPASRG